MRRRLGTLTFLLLLAVSAIADPGQCSNPDPKAAAGGAARPCGGGGGGGAAATEKKEVKVVAPDELGAALADAKGGVAILLLHKGDKCSACTAARASLAAASAALGDLATPLSLDLTKPGAAAAATKAGLPKADASSPGLVAWARGSPPSAVLAPGDATPASIAALALDHARNVVAERLGVDALGGGTKTPKEEGKVGGGGGGGGCGCGKKNQGDAKKGPSSSSSSSSSSSTSSDLPRATAFFGRDTHVRALTGAAALRALTRSGKPALVVFYAPWCGHCKNVKPELSAAAAALAAAGSPAVVAALDCDADRGACEAAGVRGFPTIKWYDDAGRGEDYSGPRDADAFEAFVAARAKPPPPEVVQLLSQATLEAACLSSASTRLCLLAFLPPLADTTAAERTAALAVLADVAAGYSGRPYGWLWAAGGDHPALEAAVGVGGYGWPALVAVVPPSDTAGAKVAHLKGSFDADGVKSFIEGARTGRVGAAGVSGDLRADGGVEAWDGGDAPAAAGGGGDDEFSLEDLGLA